MTKIESFHNRGDFANAMLDKYFDKAPNKIVSDIGAGFGYMEKKVKDIGAVWQPFDYVRKIDESTIWDLNNAAPNNKKNAGIVIFLEVLEHLSNPFLGLNNIAAHMEKGGYLILTTPNPQSSKNRLNLIIKGSLYAFQKKHLKENHVFTPWEHIVRCFLESNGFKVLEYAIVDTSYMGMKSSTLKGWIKAKIERFIEHRDQKAKGMSYGMVAVKKD